MSICRREIAWLVFCLLALAELRPAQAASYYVATSGSDANPGTLAQPWGTMSYASTNVGAGDTVLVRPGIYDEAVMIRRGGNLGSPITFRADGAVTNHLMFQLKEGASNVVVDGFNLDLQTSQIKNGIYYIGGAIYAFEFDASQSISNVWIVNNYIHDTLNHSGVGTATSGCFYMQSPDGRIWPPMAPSSCVFSNNICSNIFGGIISMAGLNHRFVNNYISRTHSHDFCAPYGANHVIMNNYVAHLEQETYADQDHPDFFQVQGLGGNYISSNILIQANILADGWNCSVVGFSQEGGDGIRDWIFMNNIWDNIGVAGGMNAPGIKFYNNLFNRCNYMNKGHALGIGWDPPGPNPNFSRGIGAGCQVYNNAFVMCADLTSTNLGWYAAAGEMSEYGTFVRMNGSTTGGGSWTSQFTTSGCSSNECWTLWFQYTNLSSAVTGIKIDGPLGPMYDLTPLANKSFWRTDSYGPFISYQLGLKDNLYGMSVEQQRFQCRSNLWKCTVSTVNFPAGELMVPIQAWTVPNEIYSNADYNFVCSTNWWPKRPALSGQADGGNFWEAHGINGGNPGFLDYLNRDYRLLASSLLRGKGIAIPAVTVDIVGNPRPNPPSIGPFEYAGNRPSVPKGVTVRPVAPQP